MENLIYSRILKQMREAVRLRHYIVTLHAVEEMDDDDFSIFDVSIAFCMGRLVERQKEYKSAEWKYLVQGANSKGRGICVATKMSITGKLVIITVYAT